MKERLKEIGKFTFHFTIAVYLLAVPVHLILVGGDALLPLEAAICTGLSVAEGIFAGKSAWRAIT